MQALLSIRGRKMWVPRWRGRNLKYVIPADWGNAPTPNQIIYNGVYYFVRIVRAKPEVLITFTGTDSVYYNLLEDHLGGVKTQVCENPVADTFTAGSRSYFSP